LLTPYLYTFSLYENPSFIIFSAEYVRSSMQNFDFFLIRLKHSHRGLFLFLLASETTSRNDVLFSTNNVCKIPHRILSFCMGLSKNIASIDTSCFYLAYIKQVTNTGYREPWVLSMPVVHWVHNICCFGLFHWSIH
jgi:hypothetical protein